MPGYRISEASGLKSWIGFLLVVGVIIGLIDFGIMIYWGTVCIWAATAETEALSLIITSGIHFISLFALFSLLHIAYKSVKEDAVEKATIWLLIAFQWLFVMAVLVPVFVLVREFKAPHEIADNSLRDGAQVLAVLIVAIGVIEWIYATIVSVIIARTHIESGAESLSKKARS